VYEATETSVIDDIIIGSMDIYDDVIDQMRNDEGYKDCDIVRTIDIL
jgi:cupin superfamily acireductone dioxygenase involved in methionine salvage